jgi:hypothetical protein
MRLINSQTLELKEFFGLNIPPYVIISHACEEEEVIFQDLRDPEAAKVRIGWRKIEQSCAVVLKDGYKYVWIDTCCTIQTHHW